MTELYFDGVASAGWRVRPKKSHKSASGTVLIGLGFAVALAGAAGLSAKTYFSPPVDPIYDPAPGQAPTQQATAAQDQPSRAASSADRGDRVNAQRGDRLAIPGATLDQKSIALLRSRLIAGPMDKSARFMFTTAPLVASQFNERFASAGTAKQDGGESRPVAVASVNVPLPRAEPADQPAAPADANQAAAAIDGVAAAIPLPAVRPQEPAQEVVKLASLTPPPAPAVSQETPQTVARSLPDLVPLPDARPARAPANAPANNAPRQPAAPQLAYARPDDGTDSRSGGFSLGRLFGGGERNTKTRLPGPSSGVAVYDINTATVYMPDGERLEAHSGLGYMRDNPRYVDAKNRGPTPPNVYNLVMRESRFHGVEAVRLLPADGRNKYGRVGLLAHTYMLRGGLSESNGCVVFKDYHRFLAAFKRGKVTRMIVVPNLAELPTYMASL